MRTCAHLLASDTLGTTKTATRLRRYRQSSLVHQSALFTHQRLQSRLSAHRVHARYLIPTTQAPCSTKSLRTLDLEATKKVQRGFLVLGEVCSMRVQVCLVQANWHDGYERAGVWTCACVSCFIVDYCFLLLFFIVHAIFNLSSLRSMILHLMTICIKFGIVFVPLHRGIMKNVILQLAMCTLGCELLLIQQCLLRKASGYVISQNQAPSLWF